MSFQQIINEALRQENKMLGLRNAIVKLRSEGIDKQTLISELTLFYSSIDIEADQDAAADVLDFLYGFCSPHMRID